MNRNAGNANRSGEYVSFNEPVKTQINTAAENIRKPSKRPFRYADAKPFLTKPKDESLLFWINLQTSRYKQGEDKTYVSTDCIFGSFYNKIRIAGF